MADPSKAQVYACSGRSNVAQLANDIAVVMDREKHAQMSCIAGVGGDVPALVKVAKSGRDICAIDGCPLACVKNSLARHGVTPKWHVELTQLGIKKRNRQGCSIQEYHDAVRRVYHEMEIIARE